MAAVAAAVWRRAGDGGVAGALKEPIGGSELAGSVWESLWGAPSARGRWRRRASSKHGAAAAGWRGTCCRSLSLVTESSTMAPG